MPLDAHGWIALATLAGATTLFVTKWLPIPVTALSIPVVLYATNVLPESDIALRGFGNQAALAIAAIFVLGAGLRETGVATLIARGLQRVGGHSEGALIASLMLATGLLSTVMSNAAVVAILLPVGVALANRSGVSASRLLMPLAFAAVLGGTITLIGTAPNFLVGDYLTHEGAKLAHGLTLTIFDFAPVGLAVLAGGIVFMVAIGRRMLPDKGREDRLAAAKVPVETAAHFGVAEKLFAIPVTDGCAIAGHSIAEADIRNRYGLGIVMVHRPRAVTQRWLDPTPERTIRPGDVLYMGGDEVAAWTFCEEEGLQFGLADERALRRILRHGATLAEIAVPPHSRAAGRTPRGMKFRERFGLNVLAVSHRDGVLAEGASDVRLEVGDAFLVSGPPERVYAIARHPDFSVLTDLSQEEDVTRAPLAIFLLFMAVVPPIVHDIPLAISGLGAALLMVATGCISPRGLRRAVDWNVIFLIVGTLPLGIALDRHEVASLAAGWIHDLGQTVGTVGVFGALFLLAATVAVLTSNAAAAVIVAPVAARTALAAGIDLKDALLVMGYGCSCAFLLPFAQCNILVMAPGGYKTSDFVRVGACMSLVMAVIVIALFSL